MSATRLSYDLVVIGDGLLARLVACLVAKSGKRVVRVRRRRGPEPALPPLPPLDVTLLPAVRETALKLGILVPLRDRLHGQVSLGHFCCEGGSGELFLDRAARDHQQGRLQAAAFDAWSDALNTPQDDPVATDYPPIFATGWWKRMRGRKAWTELDLGACDEPVDALNRPYFMHPWTACEGGAQLRWRGHRDLHVLDRPLQTFIELAEARAGVELIRDDVVSDADINRGRLVSVVTERGLHVGGQTVLWSDPIDQFDLGDERQRQKMLQRWQKDGVETTTARRLHGLVAAVDWPPFLSGPVLVGEGSFQINVEARGHDIMLETWLLEDDDAGLIEHFFAQHFPLLNKQPLTQTETMVFNRRRDPTALPPKLDSGLASLSMLPDRLIHGLGLDAPFAMAQQAAELVLGEEA